MKLFTDRSPLCALALSALLAAGCDGSVTGSTGDSLTRAEVELLVYPLILGFGGGFGQIGGAPEFSGSIDQVFDCQLGGGFEKRGSFTGTQDTASSSSRVSVEFTQAYFNCDRPVGDATLRLHGVPGVRTRVEARAVDGVGTYDFRVSGGVDFETSDGRSGRCAIDLTADLTVDLVGDDEAVLVVRGRACRIPGPEIGLTVLSPRAR